MVINYNIQKEKFNGVEKFWLNAWNDCFDKDNWLSVYQNNCRIYLDEHQSNEPEIETDNFFYLRFLKRK